MDHDRAVDATLLLEPRVRVIPVGSGLLQRELVDERRVGRDAREAHVGNTVHLRWEQQAVPVDGGGDVQLVVDVDPGELALAEEQRRTWDAPVDGQRLDGIAGEIDRRGRDREFAGGDPSLACGPDRNHHEDRQGQTQQQPSSPTLAQVPSSFERGLHSPTVKRTGANQSASTGRWLGRRVIDPKGDSHFNFHKVQLPSRSFAVSGEPVP